MIPPVSASVCDIFLSMLHSLDRVISSFPLIPPSFFFLRRFKSFAWQLQSTLDSITDLKGRFPDLHLGGDSISPLLGRPSSSSTLFPPLGAETEAEMEAEAHMSRLSQQAEQAGVLVRDLAEELQRAEVISGRMASCHAEENPSARQLET